MKLSKQRAAHFAWGLSYSVLLCVIVTTTAMCWQVDALVANIVGTIAMLPLVVIAVAGMVSSVVQVVWPERPYVPSDQRPACDAEDQVLVSLTCTVDSCQEIDPPYKNNDGSNT